MTSSTGKACLLWAGIWGASAIPSFGAAADPNRVLEDMTAGLMALSAGDRDAARPRFDEALNLIEATHGNTERARQARSLWYAEGCKDFKGEPYERAMAYYYRGVIALMDRDYDNARACFNSGILQAEYGEEEKYRCCFALLYLLDGYSCYLQGDSSACEEQFQQVRALRPDFAEPDWARTFPVLVETGKAPRKLADGVGHYELKFRRGKGFADVDARVSDGARSWLTYPAEDVAFEAMTRGGRPIDAILYGKVRFQNSMDGVATTLTSASSTVMVAAPLFRNSGTVDAVAGGMGVVGALGGLIAQNVKPRADTRCWSNLPDTIHVVFLPKSDLGGPLQAVFLDGGGQPVGGAESAATQPGDAVAWFKSAEF